MLGGETTLDRTCKSVFSGDATVYLELHGEKEPSEALEGWGAEKNTQINRQEVTGCDA